MILFLGANCPQCAALKKGLDLGAVPGLRVLYIDYECVVAEADWYNVKADSVPTLALDDGTNITDVSEIRERLEGKG